MLQAPWSVTSLAGGKDAATAAGAVGGAYVGNKVAKENFPDQEVSYRENCREVPAG